MVPEPIREYIDEVRLHLQHLTDYEGYDLSLEEKLNFLRETRHAFGRTALVLSGGGALGAFHVVRSLTHRQCIPHLSRLLYSSIATTLGWCKLCMRRAELQDGVVWRCIHRQFIPGWGSGVLLAQTAECWWARACRAW